MWIERFAGREWKGDCRTFVALSLVPSNSCVFWIRDFVFIGLFSVSQDVCPVVVGGKLREE